MDAWRWREEIALGYIFYAQTDQSAAHEVMFITVSIEWSTPQVFSTMSYRLQLESGPFLCRFIEISSYALKYVRDNMRSDNRREP